MSRQGKMHGSPFHIESARYKYAIEHENEDYPIRFERINCDALNIKTKCCTLWNTGHKRCVPYKCMYFNTNLRRTTDCSKCAFYYEKTCFYPTCPLNSAMKIKTARYCCFYYGIEKNKDGYFSIRNSCERIALTKLVESCVKKIKSKNSYIEQAKKELCSQKISSNTRIYLSNKICAKAGECTQAEILLEKYLSRLSSIGGPLHSFTKAVSSQQKMKKHPKPHKRKGKGHV